MKELLCQLGPEPNCLRWKTFENQSWTVCLLQTQVRSGQNSSKRSATGFRQVLQFAHYGSKELSVNTVGDILQAAMYVQPIGVGKFCFSFLLATTCLENCRNPETLR